MRFLRDRPISLKLAMSAACALLLLAALAWCAQHSMAVLGGVQERVSSAAGAERQIKQAQLAAEQMRALSRELQSRQTVADVTKILARAEQAGATARGILQQVRTVETDRAEQETSAALTALAGFADALRQEGEQRKTLILTRQKRLIEMRSTFEQSLSSFADELAKGGVSASGVDAVTGGGKIAVATAVLNAAGSALTEYQLAMARMQNAALLFLATGNRGAANEVRDAATDAEGRMAALLASGLPDATVGDARVVDTLGKSIQDAAQQVLDQSTRLDEFVDGTVESANLAMSQRLTAAAQALAGRADAAHAEAIQAQLSARKQILFISGGIVFVLLLSSAITGRAISRPIRAMTARVQAMADGDTSVSFGHAGRRDEVGRMAAALEILRGVVEDAFIKREMIRQFPLGMMLAEESGEFRITFANPEATQMLKLVQDQFAPEADDLAGEA